jgi:hypothetical protein
MLSTRDYEYHRRDGPDVGHCGQSHGASIQCYDIAICASKHRREHDRAARSAWTGAATHPRLRVFDPRGRHAFVPPILPAIAFLLRPARAPSLLGPNRGEQCATPTWSGHSRQTDRHYRR